MSVGEGSTENIFFQFNNNFKQGQCQFLQRGQPLKSANILRGHTHTLKTGHSKSDGSTTTKKRNKIRNIF